MNWKFKLSKRLAISMTAVFAAAATISACAADKSLTDPSAHTTTSVPDSSSTSKADTSKPATPSPVVHAGYHVSPAGTSAGDGSAAKPWDFQTALTGGNGKLQAGDTVWMDAGTYVGNFISSVAGAPGQPIVFRQAIGERATIDGTLRANGPDVAFWGFEVMRSQPNDRLPAVEARGARQKFINLVIHDSAQQGITFWDEAVDAVIYGCIVYNNGTHENLDHGTYVHNMSGTKLIKDNVWFNNLAYGIHVYAGPTDGTQVNVHVVGNISFNNGTISQNYAAKGNIIVGADSPDQGMQVQDNLLWFSGNAGNNLQVGFSAANKDVLVTGNTAFGGAAAFIATDWSNGTVQNNTFGSSGTIVDLRDAASGWMFSGNKYYGNTSSTFGSAGSMLSLTAWQSATGLGSSDQVMGGAPTTTQVFVRKNDYEGGRAFIAVYNFGHQGTVSADPSGIGLGVGQRYEVRNVQDLFGAPVLSGTYTGGSITLPMTGVNPPALIGRSLGQAPRTGPDFDTFVVIPL